jgi:2-C-methyl-D-erythritol 4-phosphate cytidylyltransferase
MESSQFSTSAVILAAGSGSRMVTPFNKIFLDLGGVTILEHSLSLFATLSFISEVVLVVSATDRSLVETHERVRLEELGVNRIVTGGERRADSSRAGVEACSPKSDLILIHDAARPFAPANAVEAAVKAAAETGAAILAIPVEDTLKESSGGTLIERTVPRRGLYRAQTPQVFKRDVIVNALAQAGDLDYTDDASLVEAAGHPVALVPGHEHNIKITLPSHLAMARAIFQIEREENHERPAPPPPPDRDRI